MNNKTRLDIFLKEKLNIKSRNVAKNLIESNKVIVNKKIITKLNYMVSINDEIEIIENNEYVSRGALKLLKAINDFKIDLRNLIVVDIGSSTGGFAQVLLENNASKVYCIDVGTEQLADKIKNDKRIVNMEKTNFKDISKNDIFDVNFFTCDVSFISVKKILLKIKELGFLNKKGVFLLKPQFELTKKEVSEGNGKVNPKYLNKVIDSFKEFCNFNSFKIKNIIESPIQGAKKKNIEFLVFLEW